MPLAFPASPSVNDAYTVGQRTWTWDGYIWSLSADTIGSASVTASELASNAVTTAKILDANVTAAKLASDAVTTVKILDANVTAAKIASDAVTTAKILDANVTSGKLASDAVTTVKIQDLAVTGIKRANDTVSTKTASYTLVAADRNTKVVMNSASATTITVNTSLFTAGDNLTLLNIGAGVCTVTAGTATVSTTGSLALAQNGGGTLYFTSAGVSVFQANGVTAASSGLVCVKAETAFSAATSVTADSVFTSTYTNYLINFKFQGSTTNNALMKLRVGGVSASTNYNYQDLMGNGGTASAQRFTAQTSYVLATNTNGAYNSYAVANLSSPQLAEPTLIQSNMLINNGGYNGPITRFFYGNHSTATAYDGVEFLCDTGTITGTYTIYGYSKTV